MAIASPNPQHLNGYDAVRPATRRSVCRIGPVSTTQRSGTADLALKSGGRAVCQDVNRSYA